MTGTGAVPSVAPSPSCAPASMPDQDFDPGLWLGALTAIGGGYALMSDRRLAFLVEDCEDGDLTGVMSQIVGRTDRQDAVRQAIERRSLGQLS